MSRTALLTLLLMAACERSTPPRTESAKPQPSAATTQPEADRNHEAIPRLVKLKDAVRTAAGVKTAPVARATLTEALTLPGEVAADPDRLARVSSPAAGRVEAVSF